MRIISSAQPFGYGPASKLVTLAKQVYNHTAQSIDFVGESVALTYITQNRAYFRNIYRKEFPDSTAYDIAISVMDPHLAVWAYANKLPVLYIDSLYWFWDWRPERFDELIMSIQRIKACATYEDTLKILASLPPHDLQFVAHSVANNSIIQSFAQDSAVPRGDPYRTSRTVTHVGPIIDTSRRETTRRNTVLISLSGLISPLNRSDDAVRYAEFVLALIGDFIGELPSNIQVCMTVNPQIREKIRVNNSRIQLVSFDSDEFLNALNRSIILFVPAGITTLYEATYYGVPVFFLPEQHDGHYDNYLRLTNNIQYAKIFPEMLFNTRISRQRKDDPDEELEDIKQIIYHVSDEGSEQPVVKDMVNQLHRVASRLVLDKQYRVELLRQQQNRIWSLAGEPFNIEKYLHQMAIGTMPVQNYS